MHWNGNGDVRVITDKCGNGIESWQVTLGPCIVYLVAEQIYILEAPLCLLFVTIKLPDILLIFPPASLF